MALWPAGDRNGQNRPARLRSVEPVLEMQEVQKSGATQSWRCLIAGTVPPPGPWRASGFLLEEDVESLCSHGVSDVCTVREHERVLLT